jgi:hypothetical protein
MRASLLDSRMHTLWFSSSSLSWFKLRSSRASLVRFLAIGDINTSIAATVIFSVPRVQRAQSATQVVAERSVLQLNFKKVVVGGDGSPCGIRFGFFMGRVARGSTDLAVKKFAIEDVNRGAPFTSAVSVVDHLGVVD